MSFFKIDLVYSNWRDRVGAEELQKLETEGVILTEVRGTQQPKPQLLVSTEDGVYVTTVRDDFECPFDALSHMLTDVECKMPPPVRVAAVQHYLEAS